MKNVESSIDENCYICDVCCKKRGKIEKPQVSFKLEKVECIDFLDLSLQWSKLNIVTGDERSPLITMIDSILSKQRDTLCSFPRRNID